MLTLQSHGAEELLGRYFLMVRLFHVDMASTKVTSRLAVGLSKSIRL